VTPTPSGVSGKVGRHVKGSKDTVERSGPWRRGLPIAQRYRLTDVDAEPPRAWEREGARCAVGSHPSNDVCIDDDPTVSRFHCEIVGDPAGPRVRDLGSRNGTLLDGVRVVDAFVRDGSLLRLGDTTLRFQGAAADAHEPALSERRRFGNLVGASAAMRAVFAVLERAAAVDSTMLLEGETGIGKGHAAEAVHAAGARRDGPFVILDCGAIPGSLIESELFGHERGAFTGAVARRSGAFEQADGGTIFLDEIGELPLDVQPKLLGVIENREIRRVGSAQPRRVDVRVIAATNRDLRAEVNEGRFRADLYFRLAVLKVALPPLRERPEDVPLLAETLLDRLGAAGELRALLLEPGFVDRLCRAAWPGNVRELRNYLERCVVFGRAVPFTMSDSAIVEAPDASTSTPPAAPGVMATFAAARQRVLLDFERAYLEDLMARHGHKVSEAAAVAGIGRVYLYKLLVKHGLK
jgi:two-component system response regulator GlrR